MPDAGGRALRKATRTAVVATAAFVIGRYGLDDDQFAVMASFGAFALSAFADFGGTTRARLAAYLAAAATGIPLVALGTALSETTWAAALAMLVVGFLAAFAGLYGGYLAAGVTSIILFYVVAAGVPAPADAIGSRVAGLVTGAVLAAAGSVLLWPDTARTDFRRPLAAALGAVASWIGAVAGGGDEPAARAGADAAVDALRPELAGMVARPAGPTRVDRAQVFLIYNLDRLRDLTARLARGEPPSPTSSALLARARGVLDDAAAAASGEDREVPVGPLLDEVRADVAATPAALARAASEAGRPDRLMRACEEAFTAQELAGTAVVAGAHARAAAGRGGPVELTGGAATLRPGPGAYPGPARDALRRARINLTPRSPFFRSSLRLGVGLAVALGVVKAFDLQHGFWVALAALVVMRTSARQTSISAVRAVAGVLVGFALSLALVLVAEPHHWVYVAILPLAIFASVMGAERFGLVAGQAAFCVLVVALFNLLKPGTWELGLVRVEDVVIGATVGIGIGALIWPRGAAGQLRAALGALIETGAGYAAGAARASAAGRPLDPAAREEAVAAARRAEDAFAAYLAERRPSPDQLAVWSEALVAGDRLWYTADRAALRAPPESPAPACAPLAGELVGAAAVMESSYRALALALEDGRPPPGPGAAPPSALDRAAAACARSAVGPDGASAAGLLWVRYWIDDLFDGLRRASAVLARADRP